MKRTEHDPTPQQIARMTQQIQKGWNRRARMLREVQKSPPVETHTVSTNGVDVERVDEDLTGWQYLTDEEAKSQHPDPIPSEKEQEDTEDDEEIERESYEAVFVEFGN